MGKAIGIDLGTTMSAMAYVDEMGRPVMKPNREGKNLTPSAVLIRGEERSVGERAKRAAVARPHNVFQFIKRRMCDPDFVFIDENEQAHRPEELSALILKKLKQDAEQALGEEVTEAVITVPAYFADLERNRTRQAGEIAGFKVLDIINEPTAAAIAYGLGKAEKDMTILVYDLGGGTFDVTIMRVISPQELRVLTSGGDRFLGGADFDATLSNYFVQLFEQKHGVNYKEVGDLQSDQDFRDKAEQSKIDLSADTEVYVTLSAAGKLLDVTLTREEFERLIKSDIDKTEDLTKDALKAAKLSWKDVDKVLLVGGSTRIPRVRDMVRTLTGKEPEMGFNPDEVVALGAAVYAANLSGVTVRNEKGEKLDRVKFHNVTAHSLGIIATDSNTKEPYNAKIILKDAEIPAKATEMFSTVEDNQTSVMLQIIQGEDKDPEHCIKVGEAGRLDGISPLPKGVPQIEVTLEYDESGIVQLHARELASGRELKAEIEYTALMSKEDVQKTAEKIGRLKVT